MKQQVFVLLLVLLFVTACGPTPEEGATATALMLTTTAEAITETPKPTETITPSSTSLPTEEPANTSTPTPLPTKDVELGETFEIEHGGFLYQIPIGYKQTFRPGFVSISSENGKVVVLLAGGYRPEEMEAEEALDLQLLNMSADINDFSVSEPFDITIGGINGLAVDVTGNLFNEDFEGRVAYVTVDGLQYFSVFGSATSQYWAAEGMQAFAAILETVEFFDPTPMENFCPVTTDTSFGYSKDNPIMVGKGDAFLSGPSFEREYLDQLRGPNGEVVEYTRSGSLTHNETILDAYQVTYGDKTVILYLDMYNLNQFRVPSGFSCAWEW